MSDEVVASPTIAAATAAPIEPGSTYADDLATLIEIPDLKDIVLVVHSTTT